MNRITVFGNVVRDVEIKVAENEAQTKYARFTVASDRSTKGDSATDYFECVAFGDLAGDLGDLRKGVFVKINGSMKMDVRRTEAETRYGWQLRVTRIERAVQDEAIA